MTLFMKNIKQGKIITTNHMDWVSFYHPHPSFESTN